MMSRRLTLAVILIVAIVSIVLGSPRAEASTPRVHAIKDARVIVSPGEVLPRATVVLRDGIIVDVGPDAPIPADARVWEAESLTVHPGLIEPYQRLSRLLGDKPENVEWRGPADEPPAPGTASAHPRVRPERAVSDVLELPHDVWADHQRLGFTSAFLVPDEGVFRGRGALLNLRAGRVSELVIPGPDIQCLAYDTGSGSEAYPRSLMGVVSLMRQTLHDADWYGRATAAYAADPRLERPALDRGLAALAPVLSGDSRVLVETDDALAALRAGQMAAEFDLNMILRGSGLEYRELADIKALDMPIFLPLNFPETPSLEREDDHLDLSLAMLRAWDWAPSNPARLDSVGIDFALSADGIEDLDHFNRNLRAAISRGLSPESALRALTVTPARILGVDDRLGSVEAGKIANLAVADGELFAADTRVRMIFVDGDPVEFRETKRERENPRGLWRLERVDESPERSPVDERPPFEAVSWLRVAGEGDSLAAVWSITGFSLDPVSVDEVVSGHDSLSVRWIQPERLERVGKAAGPRLPARLHLVAGLVDEKVGYVIDNLGDSSAVRAVRYQGPPPKHERERIPEAPTPPSVVPGPLKTPSQLLVRGATLWTCGAEGIIENGSLLVADGKIAAVGRDLGVPRNAMVVDAKGLHLTPGVMDCHSHMAIVGNGNEGTIASSAMTRIEDVINSDSPHIYRQLAGGVTLSHILHGSANPIGGQTAVMKLRWGDNPYELRVMEAEPGLKCALGENVTQKSWGGNEWQRYPKTRMGVEQFLRDRFFAALDYQEDWKEYEELSRGDRRRVIPPRRDLELDALLEVLNGQRFIHCHAYRPDEMLMIIRLADELGFQIRTFEHVQQGYKVADEMAEHGVAATAFSDWWAYKPEVYDAIPYAGALMHERGVSVSYNSDSAELARRLNLEAAKAVKYGGVPEQEALKFVTTNVADQLGLSERVGRLEPGMDADFVLWSGHPLDSGSICLQTWVDGWQYFDREEDLRMRERLAAERETLLAKAGRAYVKPRWKRDDDWNGDEDRGGSRDPDAREQGGAR